MNAVRQDLPRPGFFVRYVEMELAFYLQGEEWRVTTARLPYRVPSVGPGTAISFPEDLRKLARRFSSRHTSRLDELVQLGGWLAARAFADRNADRDLDKWRNQRRKDRPPLRIVLRFPRTAEIQSLPWELLYASNGAEGQDADWNGFLAIDPEISIVRQLDGEIDVDWSERGATSMLTVMASPEGYPKLPIAAEERTIERHLAKIAGLKLQKSAPRPDALHDRVAGTFDIVHLSGHASAAVKQGESWIEGQFLLEDEQRQAAPMPAADLARSLKSLLTRVAVLNACSTAETEPQAPIYGLCASVNRHGVAAVVGMQTELLANSGALFADAFYEKIAQGEPVDAAVSSARFRLKRRSQPLCYEAFVPVHYHTREVAPLAPGGQVAYQMGNHAHFERLRADDARSRRWLFKRGVPGAGLMGGLAVYLHSAGFAVSAVLAAASAAGIALIAGAGIGFLSYRIRRFDRLGRRLVAEEKELTQLRDYPPAEIAERWTEVDREYRTDVLRIARLYVPPRPLRRFVREGEGA